MRHTGVHGALSVSLGGAVTMITLLMSLTHGQCDAAPTITFPITYRASYSLVYTKYYTVRWQTHVVCVRACVCYVIKKWLGVETATVLRRTNFHLGRYKFIHVSKYFERRWWFCIVNKRPHSDGRKWIVCIYLYIVQPTVIPPAIPRPTQPSRGILFLLFPITCLPSAKHKPVQRFC